MYIYIYIYIYIKYVLASTSRERLLNKKFGLE